MTTTSITRKFFSQSTNGKAVTVQGTSTGTTIVHIPSTNKDELHIWASNPSSSDILLSLEMCGTTTGDVVKRTIPALTVLKVVDGVTLGSLVGTITAFAATGSTIGLFGHVNEVA